MMYVCPRRHICNPIPDPQDDAEVTKSISTPKDLNEFPRAFRELSHDTINTVVSTPNQNADYDNSVDGPPISRLTMTAAWLHPRPES